MEEKAPTCFHQMDFAEQMRLNRLVKIECGRSCRENIVTAARCLTDAFICEKR